MLNVVGMLLFGGATAILGSCNRTDSQAAESAAAELPAHVESNGIEIVFPERSPQLEQITTDTVRLRKVSLEITAPAHVAVSTVRSEFGRSNLHLFETQDLTQLYSDFVKSASARNRSLKQLERVRELRSHKVVAGKELVDAENEHAQAQAELDLLSRDYAAPDGTKPRGSIVTDTAFFSHPGRMTPNGPLVAAALVSAGLLLVWLLACANIGNLMLARAAARTREIGIRLSLGASRPRIVRQLLTEGFVHALAAGTLGVAVAYELPFVILRVMGGATASFPFRVAVDGVVVGYAVLIAALSSLAFGLAPALHATRADVAHALAEHEGLPAWRFPLRGVLLGIQVAVSVVLLVSAGLLVRAVQHQSTAFDPGFSVNDVSVVSFELPPGGYDDARTHAFVTGMTAALRALPSGAIDASGFTSAEPSFLRRGFHTFFRLPGEPPEQGKPKLLDQVRASLCEAR